MPEIVTHNALVSACDKGKQPKRVLEMFREVQLQGGVANVITYRP